LSDRKIERVEPGQGGTINEAMIDAMNTLLLMGQNHPGTVVTSVAEDGRQTQIFYRHIDRVFVPTQNYKKCVVA